MKRTPQAKHVEELLRSSRLVAGGFMGHDTRILEEILESDAAVVARQCAIIFKGCGQSLNNP